MYRPTPDQNKGFKDTCPAKLELFWARKTIQFFWKSYICYMLLQRHIKKIIDLTALKLMQSKITTKYKLNINLNKLKLQ